MNTKGNESGSRPNVSAIAGRAILNDGARVVFESNFRLVIREPLTRRAVTLAPSDGARDGVRGRLENISENHSRLGL